MRRSTDSVIADFYADTSGNLGTAVGATGTSYSSWKGGATTYVVTWYDQSGNTNNNMIQSTTTAQPIYSIINGFGTLSFDGISAYLNTSAYSATLNTQSFTIISSATNLSNTAFGTLFASRQAGPLRGYTIYKLDTNTWYFQFSRNQGTWGDFLTGVPAPAGNRMILGFNRSETTTTIASTITNTSTSVVNTSSISSPSYLPSTGSISTRIGAGVTESSPQLFFTGYINDLFYFGTSLTSARQISIEYALYNDSVIL